MHLTVRYSPHLQKWVALLNYGQGASWVKIYDSQPSDFVALHDLLELQAKDEAQPNPAPR